MDNIKVRESRAEDAPEIAKIHIKTWQCAYNGQIPDSYLSKLDVAERTEIWKKRLGDEIPPKTKHFVAEFNGKVTGFCDIGPSRDEGVSSNAGELYAMYVDSNLLGHGIGSAMMNHVITGLKNFGYDSAYLWVLKTNKDTIHFYEKHGWQLDGVEKTEEEDGVTFNELRMVHRLS